MVDKPRVLHGRHIVSSSICTPAVRTVILRTHCDETFFRDIIPVLAIESRLVEIYHKNTRDEKEYDMGGSTRRDLMEAGYSLTERRIQTLAVYVHSEFGLYSAEDGDHGQNGLSQVVACPWPKEEDETNFEPIFKAMEMELDRIAGRTK